LSVFSGSFFDVVISFGEPSHLLPFKQSFWDRPGVELDRASEEASLVIPYQQAAYRAATVVIANVPLQSAKV